MARFRIFPLLLLPLVLSSQVSADIERVFSDFSVRAAERAPDLRIAGAQASQKGAQKYSSIARWLPRLDLQLVRSQSLDFSIITSGALGSTSSALFQPQEVTLSRWNLNLNFPIYRRSVHVGLLQSLAERDQALAQKDSRRLEFEWRLRSLLSAWLLQQYRVATIQTSIDAARSSLKEARLRFELGDRTKVDVLRAEANLLSLESRRISVEQQRASDLSALLSYSGFGAEEFRTLGFESELEGFKNEPVIARAIERFSETIRLEEQLKPFLLDSDQPEPGVELRQRIERQVADSSPAYRGFVLDEDSGRARAQALSAQEWPELAFQAQWNKQGPQWTDAFQGGNVSHTYALVLSIPLFSGGTSISTWLETKNSGEATRVKSEKDRFEFLSQVMDGLIQVQSQRRNLESLRLRAHQAEEIVRLSFKSYQLGKATFTELLSSQNESIDAKINLAQARVDHSNLLRRLGWQLGVTLP